MAINMMKGNTMKADFKTGAVWLVVGAALMMQIPTKSRIFGYPSIAMVAFALAATGGLTMLISVVLADRRIAGAARRQLRGLRGRRANWLMEAARRGAPRHRGAARAARINRLKFGWPVAAVTPPSTTRL